MAWKPVKKIGDFIFNLPKEEYIAQKFIKSWSEHGSVSRPSTYFDSYFMEPPVNHYKLVINGSVGAVIKLFTLKDGKYVAITLRTFTKNQYNCNAAIKAAVYNANGTQYGTKALFDTSFDIYNEYYPNGGKIPFYFSFVINEEEQKAVLSLLGCFGSYSSGCYFTHAGAVTATGNYYYTASELYNIVKGSAKPYDPDPWSSGGYGDIGGGDGELDLTSDIIPLPDLPISAVATGFIQLYTPTLNQINELSDYMWGDGFLSNVLKLWNDPMDIIINLAQVPFNVPPAGSQKVTAGNVVTTVDMNYPANQYYELDCGEIDVKHFYDAYIDYEPYTTCEIFLPYIGTEILSMDDIMGKKLAVKYRIDLMTGACAAFILADNVLLYTFSGTCSSNIPVSGQSFAGIANTLISTVTAGATAKGAGVTSKGAPIPSSKPGAVASSLASNVMSCKASIARSGSITSNVGILGAQKPYLIFTVPRSCLPKGQNKYLGYPAFMTSKISDLKGYTEVDTVRLNNMSCTDAEKVEIEEILKGGVIL